VSDLPQGKLADDVRGQPERYAETKEEYFDVHKCLTRGKVTNQGQAISTTCRDAAEVGKEENMRGASSASSLAEGPRFLRKRKEGKIRNETRNQKPETRGSLGERKELQYRKESQKQRKGCETRETASTQLPHHPRSKEVKETL
jgi:hypothetical protein